MPRKSQRDLSRIYEDAIGVAVDMWAEKALNARNPQTALYFYFKTNGEKFAVYGETERVPKGWALVTGERISPAFDRTRVYWWMKKMSGSVPFFKLSSDDDVFGDIRENTMASKNNRIVIYDNGGKTADRYTVIIGTDVYGMSENPSSPNGYNQYVGDCADYPKGLSHTGRKLKSIPASIKRAIDARIASDGNGNGEMGDIRENTFVNRYTVGAALLGFLARGYLK